MARSRNIKPGFFKNDSLVELPFETRLLFIGLWTIADREGRLEDRPKRIKMELFPADNLDVEEILGQLARAGFIKRYVADCEKYIEIVNFTKHQNPHMKEPKSTIPAPCEDDTDPADSLIPSSLIPDSPSPSVAANPEPALCVADPVLISPDEALKGPDLVAREIWAAYSSGYLQRYGTDPVRNPKTNGQAKQLVKRLGREAPEVARFYLTHNGSFYVARMHDFGLLLSDAEKLRTEWATNTRMTTTRARQADSTQSNFDAAQQAKEMIRRRAAHV